MFYQEKLVDGVVWSREYSDEDWKEKPVSSQSIAILALHMAGPEERLAAMQWFCRGCGTEIGDKQCHCQNDE